MIHPAPRVHSTRQGSIWPRRFAPTSCWQSTRLLAHPSAARRLTSIISTMRRRSQKDNVSAASRASTISSSRSPDAKRPLKIQPFGNERAPSHRGRRARDPRHFRTHRLEERSRRPRRFIRMMMTEGARDPALKKRSTRLVRRLSPSSCASFYRQQLDRGFCPITDTGLCPSNCWTARAALLPENGLIVLAPMRGEAAAADRVRAQRRKLHSWMREHERGPDERG